MTKTASRLMRALGVSLLLSACGTDRQARVDEAAGQLLSERLGTATIAASATVAPTAAIAATSLPVATVATVAQGTAAPQAPTAVAVPWAAKLKRIPGSNDPDGFDYEAPPEVVEAIRATHTAMTKEIIAQSTPQMAKAYDSARTFLAYFVEPARSDLDERYATRERDGYAVNVLRIADNSLVVVSMSGDGRNALVDVSYSRYVIDTYYPKSMKFFKRIERTPFTVRLRVAYQPDTKTWRISHLDPKASET